MKCLRPLHLTLWLCVLNTVTLGKPWESTTARSPPYGDTIKHLTDQLMDLNKTADLVLDTRTPPKVKQQQKQKETIENSHAGIAEPVDEDSIILEESTKKTSFYKIEKPTTTSGLSTWILLSGQTSPTPPKTTKRIDSNSNLTAVTEAPNRIMKPIFKKRVTTTTRKPQTTTISENITITSTSTPAPANVTKLNKIKASVLNSAKKSTTTTTTTETSPTTVLVKIETTNAPKKNDTFNETADMNTIDSNSLPLEPKDGDAELSTSSMTTTAKPKKTRRPTTKRKKNSNRKRRPSNKNSNSTDVSKPSTKDDTLGLTPMYNYLKKQVMPAVEAGLVGLMVTAGLGIAGYFLYPFGAARRTYDIDRKDKGSYYYTDDYYSGGIAEEEAIGKVIAGMQVDNYGDNAYRKYPKNSYPNIQYKPSNMERVGPSRNYNNDKDIIEQNKETSFSVDDKQYVVGNMPKDIYPEVTPVTVPEHGPRRRRQADEMENEIFSENVNNNSNETETTTVTNITTSEVNNSTTTTTTTKKPQQEVAPHKSFLNLLNDLFRMKISLGLQLLHNATESVARYLTRVQKRVDEHYKEHNRTLSCL